MCYLLDDSFEEIYATASPQTITSRNEVHLPELKTQILDSREFENPKMFPLFSSLTTELRLKIWDVIIAESRTIEIDGYHRLSVISSTPIALQICFESRLHALKKYNLMYFEQHIRRSPANCGIRHGCCGAYINYDTDIVYFSPAGHTSQVQRDIFATVLIRAGEIREKGKFIREVQHLAFGYQNVDPKIFALLLIQMRNLKTMSLVVEDIGAHNESPMSTKRLPWSQAIGWKERDMNFLKYKRWAWKWNSKVWIVDYTWLETYSKTKDKLKSWLQGFQEKYGEKERKESLEVLDVCPIDIVRAGDATPPCGRTR